MRTREARSNVPFNKYCVNFIICNMNLLSVQYMLGLMPGEL